MEEKKQIETRSWKTNYRGSLYIHASMTNISKKDLENNELMSFVKNKNMNFGYIICKCELVDCIEMTEEFINDVKIKNNQEYICGEYSIGRYAWILDYIEPLDIPMKAKGQLNIWNYYNEFEIMNFMENINYGWIDKNKKKHYEMNQTFSSNYFLPSPNEVINNKIGICWDQVELERYYFKGNAWNIKTYFLVHYDQDKCPAHTFLTFEKNNKYYWFEHSWEKWKGIHEYQSLKELILDMKSKFIEFELNHDYNSINLELYEYKKPKYHISCQEFYNHCAHGKYIDLEKL